MAGSETLATQEWKRGWKVVLASLLGISLTTLHIYATGLFFEPLQAEFGWGRAQVAAAMMLPSLTVFFLSPLIGSLIDKWGARRIAFIGIILYCSAIASLGLTTSWIGSWWALWILLGLGVSFMPSTVWSAAVSSLFTKGRGLALAIMLCGTGVGSSLVPPITNALINGLGWRGAFFALGGLWFVIVMPIVFLFFFDARDRARAAVKDGTPAVEVDLPGLTVAEGLRSRHFYQIGIAAFTGTMVIVGFVVHLVPMIEETGMTRTQAAGLAGLVGIPSILGRLFVGHLFDRFNGAYIGAVSIGLPMVVALIMLAFPHSTVAVMVAVVVLGLAVGGEYDSIIYLGTRYLGLKKFGTLFGFIFALISVAVGSGPALAGYIFDTTGSYQGYLIAVIPILLIASLMLGTLGRYPKFEGETQNG